MLRPMSASRGLPLCNTKNLKVSGDVIIVLSNLNDTIYLFKIDMLVCGITNRHHHHIYYLGFLML